MEKYEPPVLEVLGSVRELTLATRSGDRLDDTFPAGTPISQLTVS
ncbi:lasso RiPP family leader peptide-containing protein [Geodermatophilus sp. SYSU D01036]